MPTLFERLTNALKYSEGMVEVNMEWTDDRFRFSVKDSGIGIPKKDQEYIFNSFFRSDNVGLINGTGLGLYIAHRSVDIHKGSIEFTSEADKETTFYVTLPNRSRSA